MATFMITFLLILACVQGWLTYRVIGWHKELHDEIVNMQIRDLQCNHPAWGGKRERS